MLAALAVAGMGLSGGVSAQSVEDGVLIIEAPNTSASILLDPAAGNWAYNIRGWTCLDDHESVDEAITEAADNLISAAGNGQLEPVVRQQVAREVEKLIDSNSSTRDSVGVPTTMAGAPAPGASDSDTKRNCFQTPTQADVDKLEKALADRIALTAIARAAEE